MKVTIDVHPRDLWQLTDIAEKQGMKLSEYMYRNAMSTVKTHLVNRANVEQRLQSLHAQGMHDGEISVELELTRAQVAGLRRKLGLKPNSPYKKKEEI